MTRSALALAATMLLLAGCGGGSDDAEPSDPAAGPVEPAPPPADAVDRDRLVEAAREPAPAEYRTVILESFSCGDNCYLTVRPPRDGAESRAILCTAERCGTWQDMGALPAEFVGASAEVAFGRGDQRDAAGNIMNARVRTIADIRAIDPVPADAPSEDETFAPVEESDPTTFTDQPAE